MIMDIDKLEAGRELDILVAELLTGQSRLECRVDPMNRDGEPQFFWGYPAGHDFAPEYSTDIRAAWLVVEKLRERSDGHFTLLAFTTNWRAGWMTPVEDDRLDCYHRFAVADTPALAICRAALKSLAET